MTAVRQVLWVAALTWAVIGGAASAAEPEGSKEGKTILFLGILQKRQSDPADRVSKQSTKVVTTHLKQLNQSLVEAELTDAQRKCKDPDCLMDLARPKKVAGPKKKGAAQHRDADLVLWGRIDETAPASFSLQMMLFDAAGGGTMEQTAVCDQRCDDTALQEATASLLEKYFQPAPKPEPVATTPPIEKPPGTPPPPIVTPAAVPPPVQNPPALVISKEAPAPRAGLSKGRQVGAIALGALTVAALGGSIALTVLDVRRTDAGPCQAGGLAWQDCRYSFQWLYPIGYAATGILLNGTILTLTLPAPGRGGTK